MGFGQHGQTVVHRMRARQTAAFKTHAAQIGVRFHHAFHGGGYHFVFYGRHGFAPVFQQCFVTEFGQRERGRRHFRPGHGVRAAVGAGARFKPGGQCVADARGQQAHRCVGHHFGVHQHAFGIVGEEQVGFKLARIGVNHGQRGTRRIGGGDGGAHDHGQACVIGNCFGRI